VSDVQASSSKGSVIKLRVATYNIHKGVTGIRGRPRIHDVRMALDAIDADIVFLQEVQDRNERLASHPGYPTSGTQLDFLATGAYEHRAYGMNAAYPHGHHGNAILSRHRIVAHTNHDISDHVLEKRGLLHAVTRFGRGRGREVHLICVHFGLIKRSRLRQATFLADFVQREVPARAPLIIAGDFNDWQQRVDRVLRDRLGVEEVAVASTSETPDRGVLDWLLPWRTASDTQAGVARTFPSFAPWLTLDRIYVRGFQVLDMHVPKGMAWARCSDHAPLIAELELRPARA
jgi:endonuclease/exonuclease/phosphatase family metal-dependent hydrolase